MADYHIKKIPEVIRSLKTSEKGITGRAAKERLEKHGYNEIKKEKSFTAIKLFLDQFKNALVILLLVAAGISFIMEWGHVPIDALAMLFIVLLNAILGFVQEYRAEKAMEALEKISAPTARVIRGEREFKIPAKELVPGDILVLEAGDIVAADARLFEESSLQVDEASLTGESVPSKKHTIAVKKGSPLTDQDNMVFMGTNVTYGKGKAYVVRTGMKTEFGKIAETLQESGEVQTPLQKKFSQMAKQIGGIVMALVLVVFIVGLVKGEASFGEMLLFALSLTVAAVPNSLPVIVTVGLSMGTKRLAKKNMLIKKLPAAESLGAVTIICSDKTGTITKNQMTVKKLAVNGKVLDVSGSGYDPAGDFYEGNREIDPNNVELLLRIGSLCNNSKLVKKDGKYNVLGDPTEGSLVVLGKKGGLDERYLSSNFQFLEELPFDSDRKMMSVLFKNTLTGKKEAYVKGAPDLLLRKCTKIIEKGKVRKLTEEDKKEILKLNDGFADDALRVLGLAYKDVSRLKKFNIETVEDELVFVGLTGMIDPPREEVRGSINQCHEAGIEVMVITGDSPVTARAVARQIGLFKKGDMVMTGEDIEKMDDKELEKKINDIRIIARALPIQKSRVVDALKKNGHVVAMTGDGVNDAPALKKSDIGISMGITGTDVAKEVSRATLVDDNFSSIVNAISEGRNIYDKMIKSTRYLLSCNSGEIFSVFIAIMLNFPLPMIPLQILLMNLLTDNFPALGLGFETSEENIMKRPPRDPSERPITGRMFLTIVLFGIIMAAATLFMFYRSLDEGINTARTVAFTTLVMAEMFAVMSSRSLLPNIKRLNPFENLWLLGAIALSLLIQVLVVYWPPLQKVFETVALGRNDLLWILGISAVCFVVMELSKYIVKIGEFKEKIY